jgi:hypothetical protein
MCKSNEIFGFWQLRQRDEKDFDAARHAFLAFGACVSTKEEGALARWRREGHRARRALCFASPLNFSLSAHECGSDKRIFLIQTWRRHKMAPRTSTSTKTAFYSPIYIISFPLRENSGWFASCVFDPCTSKRHNKKCMQGKWHLISLFALGTRGILHQVSSPQLQVPMQTNRFSLLSICYSVIFQAAIVKDQIMCASSHN